MRNIFVRFSVVVMSMMDEERVASTTPIKMRENIAAIH
jgi:hypothetical protein